MFRRDDLYCSNEIYSIALKQQKKTGIIRNRNTVKFLGIWEIVYSQTFNYGKSAVIKSMAWKWEVGVGLGRWSKVALPLTFTESNNDGDGFKNQYDTTPLFPDMTAADELIASARLKSRYCLLPHKCRGLKPPERFLWIIRTSGILLSVCL